MELNFTNISLMASKLTDDQVLMVTADNSLEVFSPLEGHQVKAMPANAHQLNREEFFNALAHSAGEKFANTLREGLLLPATPITAREIRTIAAQSASAIETQSHIRQLASGLLAENHPSVNPQVFTTALAELKQHPELSAAFAKSPLKDVAKRLEKAIAAFAKAHSKLENVNFAKLGNAKVSDRLADLAHAQSNLTEQVAELANRVRQQLINDGSDNDDLFARLETLDEQVESMDHSTARLESLSKALGELGKRQPMPAQAVQQINALVSTEATLSAENLREAKQKLDEFSESAQELFSVMAHLDNAQLEAENADEEHPVQTAAELLTAAKAAFDQTAGKLAQLRNQPGIDADALKQFELNLRKLGERIHTCQHGVRAKYALHAFMGLDQMLVDGIKGLTKDGMVNEANEVKQLQLTILNDVKALLERNSPQRLVQTLADPNSKLRRDLVRAADAIRKLDVKVRCKADTQRPMGVARMYGLHRFEARFYKLLNSLDDTMLSSPFSQLNSKLLGEVLRGELDLANYLELQDSDLPEELIRADLVPVPTGNADEPEEKSGEMSSVEFVNMSNRNGAQNVYVVKNHEASEYRGAYGGIANYFSEYTHAGNVAKLNYASHLGAELIGCGKQITSCCVVRNHNRAMLAQEKVNGASVEDDVRGTGDPSVFIRDAADGSLALRNMNMLTLAIPRADLSRVKISLQLDFAKLEWADWLSGQLDRHLNNVMFNVSLDKGKDGKFHVSTEVKGIDNDASFPEGRPGLNRFVPKNTKFEMDASKRGAMENLDRKGVRSCRKPTFLPRSVMVKLQQLDVEEYRRQMSPYLSEEALESAVSRLQEMKDSIPEYVANHRVVDDRVNVNQLTDDEATQLADEMETKSRTDYQNCERTFGHSIAFNDCGGFYGALSFN